MPMLQRFAAHVLVLIALMFAAPAWAQADLEVSVVDGRDAQPLAGVAVHLGNQSTGFDATAVTDSRGKARFGGLSTSGRYVASIAETADFAPVQSGALQLRANFDRSVTLVAARHTTEEIVVRGQSIAGLNRLNAEVSSSLAENDLRTLPIEARDITRALFRLPNVTQATGFYPEAPNVSINGANSLYTQYLIDGLDNNENFLGGQKFPVPLGFAQNVTVLANNFSAEFGRSANGVVNVTSKAGSNETKGEVYFLTRPGGLAGRASGTTTDLSGNVVQDNFTRYQGGFDVGGPVVRDKTFYFVDLEYTRDIKDNQLASPDLGVKQKVGGANAYWLGSLRLDQVWNDDWSSSLRFNQGQVSIGRQAGDIGGGVTFPSAANAQDRIATLAAFSTTYKGEALVYQGSVAYSRFHWNYAAAPAGPQVSVQAPSGNTIAVIGSPGYVFDDTENTVQTQQKITYRLGDHTLKAGIDVLAARFRLAGGGNVDGNYTVRLTAAQLSALRGVGAALAPKDLPASVQVVDYGVEVQPNAFGRTQWLAGGYVEDQFAATADLTLTAGLRWDYDSITGEGKKGAGELDDFAPRFSANYALNESMALRGGVGLFYDKIPYTVLSDALQGNSTAPAFKGQLQRLIARGILPASTDLNLITFDGNLTVNPPCTVYLACPTPAQAAGLRNTASSGNLRILNPNGYHDPYALQAMTGYQWQINDTLLFYADAIYSRTRHLVRLVDLNAPAPFVFNSAAFAGLTAAQIAAMTPAQRQALGLVRSAAAADATRPIAAVAGGARSIIVSDSGGNARYEALNFTLAKDKGDDRYAYRVSYTLSRLQNDTDDLNFRAQDANNFGADWGPSLNARTHVISGEATFYATERLSFSLAGLLQSGQPVNYVPDAQVFGTQDLNGDGRSYGDTYDGNSDRYPGARRNSGRLPWSKTFDAGVQYGLPVASGTIEIRLDVFNIFDANNLTGFPANFTVSNQVQIGGGAPFVQRSAAPPRTFQLGARYAF